MHFGVPLLWGWTADRVRRPNMMLLIACLGSLITFSPLVFVRTMPAMMPIILLHQLFQVAIIGLADSLAIERARQGEDYTRIRIWGSLGFSATCLISAQLVSMRGLHAQDHEDPFVPVLIASGFAMTFAASLAVRAPGPLPGRERPHARDVAVLLRDPRFRFLLLLAPLHWACLAPFHGFFGILLQDRGLPPGASGISFLVSTLGEMVCFWYFQRLRVRAALSSLLAVASATTVARWLLTATVTNPAATVALQALHALTFGLFWATAMAWLSACVPPKLRATGQTLFTATTFGFGSIAGMTASGFIYDLRHDATPAFWAAGILEIVPLALILLWGQRLDPERAE